MQFAYHSQHPRSVAFIASTRRLRGASGGFSLIEVLVTILILAFGLLGVAGLLVKGVSNASASEAMGKANQLIVDMADRMRANPTVALSATSEYLTSYGDAVPTAPTTVALQDKEAWLTAIAAQLPSGQGRITNSVAGGARQVTISIRWSGCLGTLEDTSGNNVLQSCKDNPDAVYKSISHELRL